MAVDVGDLAPDFELRDQHGTPVRLSDHRGRKVVLIFYPLAFSGVCHGELNAIRGRVPAAVADDVQLLTVSVDSMFAHRAWADRRVITFPLLSDFWPHGEVARAYGVFDEEKGVAVRGTFIIDGEGVVRWKVVNPDPRRPRHRRLPQGARRDLLTSARIRAEPLEANMPCFRCGARQTDPVRGASPWKRGVRHETQVLICPDCQRSGDLDLDTCHSCGSTALICRLGEIECRSCGAVRLAAGQLLLGAATAHRRAGPLRGGRRRPRPRARPHLPPLTAPPGPRPGPTRADAPRRAPIDVPNTPDVP